MIDKLFQWQSVMNTNLIKTSNRSEMYHLSLYTLRRGNAIKTVLPHFFTSEHESGPQESNCWFSFAPAFQLFRAVESLSL